MPSMLDNLVSLCNSFSDLVRRRFQDMHCAIAQSLEILGDWWTFLLVRDAFLGARRFADFAARLGISKNILTARLAHLVKHGIFERVDAGVHGVRYEYQLSAKGKDLVTVVTALRQWGDRWIYGEGKEPVLVLDRRTGRSIPRLRLLDEAGAPLGGRDLEVRLGAPPPPQRPPPSRAKAKRAQRRPAARRTARRASSRTSR
jgi:DNA-binding HxlR family transcriptional regulator